MLSFVGLGLYGIEDVTIRGRDVIKNADHVYTEFYTSAIMDAGIEDLESYYSTSITQLARSDIEQNPDEILENARQGDVALLTGGDPMISTTHSDLRLRAINKDIDTKVIHGQSIETAVKGETGLQNYRFGPPTTLPFPEDGWMPESPMKTISENLERNLHTLVYLDIKHDDPSNSPRYMTISYAIDLIQESDISSEIDSVIGCARIGSDTQEIKYGSLDDISGYGFGDPLHIIVIPSELHEVEAGFIDTYSI